MTPGATWVWGRHAVVEALRAGSARRVLLASGRRASPILHEIRDLARGRGVPVREVTLEQIERLAPGAVTQGVAAEIVERRAASVRDLILPSPTGAPFVLLLDQIQDPHNLGALIRTADGAGVSGVVVPERRSASVTGTVAKASAGAVSHVPVVEVSNLVRALDELRNAGLWLIGLDGAARDMLYTIDLQVPLGLVVGSEASGLRRLTRERCDVLARLPMLGAVASLNASVAGSIAMYEVVRQRQSP